MQWLHLSPSLVSWVVLAVCHSPASVLQLFLCFKQLTIPPQFELTPRIWYFFSTQVCFSSSFSHAGYQFLSCVIQRHQSCSFWVFKCFSFSLSFWSSSKFWLAPASWTSKLLIGLCTEAARPTGIQFVFPSVAAFVVLTFVQTSFCLQPTCLYFYANCWILLSFCKIT